MCHLIMGMNVLVYMSPVLDTCLMHIYHAVDESDVVIA